MENALSKVHPELIDEWSERNLPITPDDVGYGSKKSFWWKGSCGHEWQASAKARSAGEKCPICSGARVIPGINDLATTNPELAEEWSGNNGTFSPTMVSAGSHKKVIWRGKCGHEWTAAVKSRTQGSGCPYCSHNRVLPGFNDLASVYPQLAEEWSEKNLPLLPTMVTPFANRKVWWRCGLGHEWNTLIPTRSDGSRCPYCGGIVLLKGFNDFACGPKSSSQNGYNHTIALKMHPLFAPPAPPIKQHERLRWWRRSKHIPGYLNFFITSPLSPSMQMDWLSICFGQIASS